MPGGRKDHVGKTRWALLPWEETELVVKVLMHGAKEYGDENWKEVDNAKVLYFEALMRHLTKRLRGERTDEKSHLPHMAHVIANAYFLLWFDNTRK